MYLAHFGKHGILEFYIFSLSTFANLMKKFCTVQKHINKLKKLSLLFMVYTEFN